MKRPVEFPIYSFSGINENYHRGSGEAVGGKNIILNRGTLSIRPGWQKINTTPVGEPIKTILTFRDTMLACYGTTVAKSTGGDFTVLKSDVANPYFEGVSCLGGSKLVITNGQDILKWDDSSLQPLGGNPPSGKYPLWHRFRLWLVVNKTLHISDFNNPELWSNNTLVIENPNGDDINGTTIFQDKPIIFTPGSFHTVYGVDPESYSVVDNSMEIGLTAHRTIREVNGRLYWLDQNFHVREYNGADAIPVSDKVRQTLGSINKNYAHLCFAWEDGNCYKLAIPTGGNQTPNIVLTYDTETREWYPPHFYQASHFATYNNLLCMAGDSHVYIQQGITDSDVPIQAEYETENIDCGNYGRLKNFKKLILHLEKQSSAGDLTVAYSIDNGPYTAPIFIDQSIKPVYEIPLGGAGNLIRFKFSSTQQFFINKAIVYAKMKTKP